MKRSTLMNQASRLLARRGKRKLARATRKLGVRAGDLTPAESEKLGRKAFHKGKTSIPIHDKEFMARLRPMMGEVGTTISYLKAWHKGWHSEQQKAANRELKKHGFDIPDSWLT